MKKILLVICMMLFATPVLAVCDDAHGGVPVAGGYCRSKFPLIWWSAFMWCEGIGMEMVSMYDVCPDWEGRTIDVCPAIDTAQTGIWVWTTTASGTNSAYRVSLSSGAVVTNLRNHGYGFNASALCK